MSTLETFRRDSKANLSYMLREEENRVRRTQQAALERAEAALALSEAALEAERERADNAEAAAKAERDAKKNKPLPEVPQYRTSGSLAGAGRGDRQRPDRETVPEKH